MRIQKKIGRIFRQYNIIEYKGPKDCHTVNSFFKVMGYGGILQSSTRREREISPEEITVTLVQNQLDQEENLWLGRLRQDLTREKDVEALAIAYDGKENDPLYRAAMGSHRAGQLGSI